ncbi:MAG: hypothetical protein AAF581_19540 [Planctomycetota bacterium]
MSKSKSWLLGVGLDGDDGHTRITRAEDMVLVGGSNDTHGQMQEHAIRIGEELERRGKSLNDCSSEEVVEIVQEARDRC